MKNTKKIILLIFSVLCIAFVSLQLFYIHEYKGNLIFYISNESLKDSAQMEIYIDGNKMLEGELTNQVTHLYKPHPVKVTLGNHTAIIKINGEFSKKIELNTFLVTFVVVDYYGDRSDTDSEGNRDCFFIDIRKKPLFAII